MKRRVMYFLVMIAFLIAISGCISIEETKEEVVWEETEEIVEDDAEEFIEGQLK